MPPLQVLCYTPCPIIRSGAIDGGLWRASPRAYELGSGGIPRPLLDLAAMVCRSCHYAVERRRRRHVMSMCCTACVICMMPSCVPAVSRSAWERMLEFPPGGAGYIGAGLGRVDGQVGRWASSTSMPPLTLSTTRVARRQPPPSRRRGRLEITPCPPHELAVAGDGTSRRSPRVL